MRKILAALSLGLLFCPSRLIASPPPPPQEWERFLAADRVILAKVVDPNPPAGRFEIVKYLKGEGLEKTIFINLQNGRWGGGASPSLYRGDRVIAFLKQTPPEKIAQMKKEAASNPQFADLPTTRPGVYDLLYQYDPFMGQSLLVITDKTQDELDVIDLLSHIYYAKDDESKCKRIQDELVNDSPLVHRFPFLFTTERYSFIGYASDPQSPKTWLPIHGNTVPKSFSEVAGDYLIKHASTLNDQPSLTDWLVRIIVQNYDEAVEKMLFKMIKEQPLRMAETISASLWGTRYKKDAKKKQELLRVLVPRMREALGDIPERLTAPAWDPNHPKEQIAHRFMILVSRLAMDVGTQDKTVHSAVEEWARKSPWHPEAMNALGKLGGGGEKNLDLLNRSALRTRDQRLIKQLSESGNEKTLDMFLERVARGSPWGDNYEAWDFAPLGTAITTLTNRLGGNSKDKAIHAYVVYMARWYKAHPTGFDPKKRGTSFCNTEEILPVVNNTLITLSGQNYHTPEEWLHWAMKPEDKGGVAEFSQHLLRGMGDFLVAEDGIFETQDCETGKDRRSLAKEKKAIDIYQGYSVLETEEVSFVELKDNFPSGNNLKAGKRYQVTLIINKMDEYPAGDYRARQLGKDGKYYDGSLFIEDHYVGLKNEKNQTELVNVTWIRGQGIPEFLRAWRGAKPADMEEFKKIFSSLHKYGVPPPVAINNGYAVLRFKDPIKIKIDPTFPKSKEFLPGDFFEVSEIFVKVQKPSSAGGWGSFILAGPGQYYSVDPAGAHFVFLSTRMGSRALVNSRWAGRSLSLENLSLDSFPEQKGELDKFMALFSTRDRFGHP